MVLLVHRVYSSQLEVDGLYGWLGFVACVGYGSGLGMHVGMDTEMRVDMTFDSGDSVGETYWLGGSVGSVEHSVDKGIPEELHLHFVLHCAHGVPLLHCLHYR